MLQEKQIKKHRTSRSKKRKYTTIYIASIFLLVAFTVFQTQADTLTLFLHTYLLTENVVEDKNVSDGVIKRYELRYNNFSNEIPPETEISKISLRFLVSNTLDAERIADATATTTETTTDVATSTQPSLEFASTSTQEQSDALVDSDLNNEEEVLPMQGTQDTVGEQGVLVEDVSTTEDVQMEIPSDTEEIQEPVETSQSSEESGDVVEENEYTDIPSVETQEQTELPSETVRVESYSDISLPEVYVSEILPLDATLIGTSSTSTDETQHQTSSLFEVLYSLDGTTWQSLGDGDFSTNQEMTFDLSHLTLDDVPSLEIVILYTTNEVFHKNILFSQMRLEVECVLPETVLVPDASSPVDPEPHFGISSIKVDVQSDDIRAVLLEKGGMFELWYTERKQNPDNELWKQLVTDSSLSATTPLLIKERTVFWLDKNQQTIFGYSIDEQSLFGDSLVSNGENTLSLRFRTKYSEEYIVLFNPALDIFEISSARNIIQ